MVPLRPHESQLSLVLRSVYALLHELPAGQFAALSLTNIANSFTPQPEAIALCPSVQNAGTLVGTTNLVLLVSHRA
jgi:hypothetical protein